MLDILDIEKLPDILDIEKLADILDIEKLLNIADLQKVVKIERRRSNKCSREANKISPQPALLLWPKLPVCQALFRQRRELMTDMKKLEIERIYYRACQFYVDLRIDNFGLEGIQGVGELLSTFAERAGRGEKLPNILDIEKAVKTQFKVTTRLGP